MSRRRSAAWAVATMLGLAVGATLSSLLVGAIGRPLSPLLDGLLSVALYGAVIGLVSGAVQLAVIPRAAVRWPVWIGANVAGVAFGYVLVAIVGETLGNAVDPRANLILGEGAIEDTSGAVLGLAMGYAQWRALRGHLPRLRWWLVATAAGAAIGYGTAAAALELFEIAVLRANVVPSYVGILGLFIGVAQAVALMRTSRAVA